MTRLLSVATLVVWSWLAPATAAAYEDTLTLGVEAGSGIVVVPETTLPCCGALVGVSSSIGLNDVWSLRAHVDWVWHPSGGPDLQVGLLGLEGLYLIDIVQLVPFFGIGIDTMMTIVDGAVGVELGAHAVLGLEYLLSRTFMLGVDLRPHFLFLSILETGRVEPVYITVSARASWRFDL